MSGKDWMVSVHCDWNKCLEREGGSAWVLYKERDRPAVSTKLWRRGEVVECEEESWVAEVLSKRELRLSLPGRSVCLLAPTVSLNVAGRVTSLDISGGGLGLAATGGTSVSVWRTEDGTVRRELAGHLGEVYTARLFPSGVVALTGGADMSLKIWSVQTGNCPVTLSGHKGAITATQIVNRGKNVISVSKDGTARLWSCGEKKCLEVLVSLDETINCCHLSDRSMFHPLVPAQQGEPAGVETEDKVLAVGGEAGTITVLAVSPRTLLYSANVSSPVNAVLLTTDKLYAGCQDGAIHVISHAGSEILRASTSPVLHFLRLESEDLVVTSRQDGSVTLYLTRGQVELTGSDTDPVYCLAENGPYIYSGCRDGWVRKYDKAALLKLARLC